MNASAPVDPQVSARFEALARADEWNDELAVMLEGFAKEAWRTVYDLRSQRAHLAGVLVERGEAVPAFTYVDLTDQVSQLRRHLEDIIRRAGQDNDIDQP